MLDVGYFEERRILAQEMIQSLQTDQAVPVQAVIGYSGSGKTQLAEICEHLWTVSAGKGQSVWLRGDSAHTVDDYHPFETGLDEVLEGIRSQARRIPLYSASYSGLGAGVVGGFVKQAIDGITTEGSRLNIPAGTFRYVAGLKRAAKRSPLLLILDDVQTWDAASLRLLKILLSEQAIREFPFLGSARYLLIYKGAAADFVSWKQKNLTGETIPLVKSSYPSLEQIPEVLAKFGFDGALSPDVIAQIGSITGGHLSLVKNLALLLQSKSPSSATEIEQLLRSRQGVLNEAMSQRLRDVPEGEPMKRLLIAASVIGDTFEEQELGCISRAAATEGKTFLQALEYGLLRRADNRYAFENEIVRSYFLDCSPEETARLNEKFADCLRMLRPGAYLQRAKHLRLAGLIGQALVMEGLDFLSRAVEGLAPSDSRLAQLVDEQERENSGDTAKSLKLLLSVIAALSAGNPHAAYHQIREMAALRQPALEGWRIYLYVRCSIKTRSREDIRAALIEAQSRNEYVHEEFDIWMRVKGAEIIGHVYLADELSAMREYHRLMADLESRSTYDPTAAFHVAVLQRRSPSLFDAQRSVPECEKAVAFFRPETPDDWPIYPRQLFMARTNLSGSLISSGRAEDAFYESEAALQLCGLPGVEYPGFELALSNHLVAGWLSGLLSSEGAHEQYQYMLEKHKADHDRYLLETNMAVLHAVCGRLEEAHVRLRRLLQSIELDGADDSYYLYWACSNAAWVCFERNCGEEASLHWQRATQHQDCVHPANRRFLKARHRTLEQFLTQSQPPSKEALAAALERAGSRLDTPWRFWGRAYLPSDIHFWSSS